MLTMTLVGAVIDVPARAHHSIAGAYDVTQQVTVQGVIMQVRFVNPHPYLMLDDVDGSGRPRSWRLEMDNRFELVQIGVTEETLKPGDRIVVNGNPARNDQRSLYVRRLDRPTDGFRYEQVGFEPKINFVPLRTPPQ
jgi:Family of unknown function (DUF6152)